ncbi:MAG: Nif3-like dinuclear metal center hexameric protein [Deltaproteobacteria bacterium]|nr:Nif3-like dinuclear metal center hexameric protein [Deltaproteobacteria bacterium]
MKNNKFPLVQDLAGLLNKLYPSRLAEEWDNVGLQIGDPTAAVKKVLVALDPTETSVETAAKNDCQLLITHHPLIFHPLKRILTGDEPGKTIYAAITKGIAVLCAHTNVDRAAAGMNRWLAERLALSQLCVLEETAGGLLKLAVYVPAEYEEAVAEALFDAGAGHIGAYDRCSFRSHGEGTFRPGAGTSPFRGQQGKDERGAEVRLETILPRELSQKAIRRMLRAHPYEEVAYDLYPLENIRNDVGLGCIGRLPEPLTLEGFALKIKELLGIGSLRVVGPGELRIEKVAVCGGSGISLLGEARRKGADVLVTGDIKYHEARSAEEKGIALIDAGHFHTEKIFIHHLVHRLRQEAAEEGWPIALVEMKGEKDPFRFC